LPNSSEAADLSQAGGRLVAAAPRDLHQRY
jgi:hypothetical protein